MDSALKGKRVFISGASGGIGQATARAFAAEGASLVLHAHTQLDAIERLQGTLGVSSVTVQADLRDEGQVEGAFVSALETFERIDCLVVNAAIWSSREMPLHEMSLDQWRRTLDSNLTSAFLTCRTFLKHVAKTSPPSASVVIVGSTAAIYGEAGNADYAASKSGAAYGLTLSLKNEIVRLSPRGRVNCVCPGWTDTPMVAQFMQDEALIKRATATVAMGKIATPEDVANAIVFLSSDRLAGHISGAIVPVTGGMEGRILGV